MPASVICEQGYQEEWHLLAKQQCMFSILRVLAAMLIYKSPSGTLVVPQVLARGYTLLTFS